MSAALYEPQGCRFCGVPEREHMQRWKTGTGWHKWERPTLVQVKARMLARRRQGARR